jgi:hypothetical protein
VAKTKRNPGTYLATLRPVESPIHVIRGKKVMLDSDLAGNIRRRQGI